MSLPLTAVRGPGNEASGYAILLAPDIQLRIAAGYALYTADGYKLGSELLGRDVFLYSGTVSGMFQPIAGSNNPLALLGNPDYADVVSIVTGVKKYARVLEATAFASAVEKLWDSRVTQMSAVPPTQTCLCALVEDTTCAQKYFLPVA